MLVMPCIQGSTDCVACKSIFNSLGECIILGWEYWDHYARLGLGPKDQFSPELLLAVGGDALGFRVIWQGVYIELTFPELLAYSEDKPPFQLFKVAS